MLKKILYNSFVKQTVSYYLTKAVKILPDDLVLKTQKDRYICSRLKNLLLAHHFIQSRGPKVYQRKDKMIIIFFGQAKLKCPCFLALDLTSKTF